MATRPTPAQIRGARAMLGWSLMDLARAADVSILTVKLVEVTPLKPMPGDADHPVRVALEKAGIVFLFDDVGCSTGVMVTRRDVVS